MLYYNFNGYEGFKELFGINKHGNGVCSRKNKILLSYIKNKELLHPAVNSGNNRFINISNMPELKKVLSEEIEKSGYEDEKLSYHLSLNGRTYYSSFYSTDRNNGLCEDGDVKAVRYISNETGRAYKMKAGKLFRALVLETGFGKTLPEQVLVYLCEEFAADWQTYAMGNLPKNKLCVDKDFQRIYSSESCSGNFESCMVDKGYHSFYENAVDASAAYLTNEEGLIIARCIIYNEAKDENGKVWRLAERQYATEGNDILKRALIDALIKREYIDGYKNIGAGCSEARNFVDIQGNSLSEHQFSIACDLGYDDILSYQDSFKWYDEDERIATNYGKGDLRLDTTEGSIDGEDREYDDWHDCYCDETRLVFYKGREYYCDVDRLDEFTWVEELDEYHHNEDVSYCQECESYFLNEDGSYSGIMEDYYCCDECKKSAEETFKQENWYFSDYDEEYYEKEEEVTAYQEWNCIQNTYLTKTISSETLKRLLENDEFYLIGGEAYDKIDEETGMPYEYELEELAV